MLTNHHFTPSHRGRESIPTSPLGEPDNWLLLRGTHTISVPKILGLVIFLWKKELKAKQATIPKEYLDRIKYE